MENLQAMLHVGIGYKIDVELNGANLNDSEVESLIEELPNYTGNVSTQ